MTEVKDMLEREPRQSPSSSSGNSAPTSGGNNIATGQDSPTSRPPHSETVALPVVNTNKTKNRKLRQLLLKSRAGYRAIFETTSSATAIVDAQGGLVMANRAFARFSGYSKRELEKKSWTEFVDRRDLARMDGYHRRRLSDPASTPKEYEFRFIDRAGNTRQVLVKADLIPGTQMVVMSLSDVTERKQAEEKLQESEQRIRAMFEAAPEGIAFTDMWGTILDANQSRVRMHGYASRQELIGKNISDLVSETERGEVRETFTNLMKKDPDVSVRAERTMVKKDGSQFDIEVHLAAIKNREGNSIGTVGIVRDITDRKRAEEKLKESEKFNSSLLENAPDAIVVIEPDTTIRYVNPALEKLTGFSAREIIGKKIPYPWWRAETLDQFSRVSPKKIYEQQKAGERLFQKKNGALFWVDTTRTPVTDENDKLKYTMSIWVDITERKQAEQLLRQERDKAQQYLNVAGVMLLALDANHKVTLINKRGCEILGTSPGDIIGRDWIDFVPERIRGAVQNVFQMLIAGETTAEYHENPILNKRGEERILAWHNSLLRDGAGNIIGTLSSGEDITERERAEQKLKESEAFNSSLLQNAPNGIVVIEPDSTIRYVNPALEKLTGFAADEIIGKRIPYPWWRPEAIARTSRTFPKQLSQARKIKEKLFQKKNGEMFRADITRTPVTGEDGTLKYTMSIWVDVTERKRAENELRKSEEKYRNLVATTRAVIVSVDLDGRLTFVNDQLCRMLGYSEKELLGRPFVDIIHPDERDNIYRKFQRWTMAPKIGTALEFRVMGKDGNVSYLYGNPIPITDGSKILGFSAVLTDATGLKQAEAMFQTLTEYSAVGIYIIQDGKFKYVNPQFSKYTGYSAGELLTTDPLSLVFPADADVVRGNNIRMLKNAPGTYQPFEYRLINKSGEVRWVMQVVASITYQGGRAVLASFMDITEYKNMERKLFEYRELDKVKSDLLSTVSHELRTPLATIKGYTTLLLNYNDKLEADEKVDDLQTIDKAADRLTDLVDHLLDISRLDAGLLKLQKGPTDVSQMLREAAAEARVRISTHRIVLKTERRLPVLNIDVRRIRQVLDNLIDNARKYSDEGAEVLIRARRLAREVVISVTDYGVGIPASELDRVFDRMHRIENRLTGKVAGLGLGLSLCKGLVDAHGGRIWMESEEGKGSTCSFALPTEPNC